MNHYPPLVTIRSLTILFRENWLQGFMLGHLPWRSIKRPYSTQRLIFLMAQTEATLHFLSWIIQRPSNEPLVVLSALIWLLDDAERKLLLAWISGHLRLGIDLLDWLYGCRFEVMCFRSVILLASLIRVIARVWPLHKAICSSAVLDTRSLLVKKVLILHSILKVVEFIHFIRWPQPLLSDIHVLQDEFLDHFSIRDDDFRLPRSRWVNITWSL